MGEIVPQSVAAARRRGYTILSVLSTGCCMSPFLIFPSYAFVRLSVDVGPRAPVTPGRFLRPSSRLHSSAPGGSDDFRKSLESSWNAPLMGTAVPSDPEGAALAAARCVCSYLSLRGDGDPYDDGPAVVRVEVGLPAYDPTSGPNYYDEAASAAFAVALAAGLREGAGLRGNAAVVCVDGGAERTAGDALRRRARMAAEAAEPLGSSGSGDDVPEMLSEEPAAVEDDSDLFAALGDAGGDGRDPMDGGAAGPEESIDSFRAMLERNVDADAGAEESGGADGPGPTQSGDGPAEGDAAGAGPEITLGESSLDSIDSFRAMLEQSYAVDDAVPAPDAAAAAGSEETAAPVKFLPEGVRLGSLLGDVPISRGVDGASDVRDAVDGTGRDAPAVLSTDEALVILAPHTRLHSMAIRRVLAEYCGGKTAVVLINCRCDPLPRELARSETVYGISAFVARRKVSDENVFGSAAPPGTTPPLAQPKAVVMRRYPRDWEVFVDTATGDGLEFVRSVSPKQVGFTRGGAGPSSGPQLPGPGMGWVAGLVKDHIISKEKEQGRE